MPPSRPDPVIPSASRPRRAWWWWWWLPLALGLLLALLLALLQSGQPVPPFQYETVDITTIWGVASRGDSAVVLL